MKQSNPSERDLFLLPVGGKNVEIRHRDADVVNICNHINLVHAFADRILVVHGPMGCGRTSVLKVVENIQKKLSQPSAVHFLDSFAKAATAQEREKTISSIRVAVESRDGRKDIDLKPIVIIDDFEVVMVPPPLGGPITSHLDPIVTMEDITVILSVCDERLPELKRHFASSRFEYYQIKPLSEKNTIDVLSESLRLNKKDSAEMLSFVKKLVRYQHFVTSPNLKRILRVVYSSLLNLADSITDTLTGRINTKPGEFGNQSLYHSVSMYSKFDRKEIKQAMEFTFSRESVQEQLDSRIILGDQNKRFVVNALGRKFLGLSEPGKPISTIMAIGTTGTGKTETAKSIAEIGYGSSERLIIVNMNEFSQSHHVNKLLGSAPGYVGYGEGSFLTRELEKHNPCVILFDEIEKAHPEVLNTLLNILDEGMLTDGTGKRYDITKCIVILTSNMGIELLGKKPLGFSEKDKTYEASDLKEHIIEMGMRPEFLNRIDGFLVYEKLSDEMRRKIAVMNLDKLTQGILSEREVTFKDSEKIVEYIVENSNPNEGGRSINRVIKNVIIPSIIDLMIEKEETEQIEFLPENIKEEYEI